MDRASFDKLVLDHLPAMQRLAVRLTGDPHAAEDLMQEALLKAVRFCGTFRGESSFSTWMTRIVIHAFRDSLANKERRIVVEQPSDQLEETLPSPLFIAQSRDMAEHIAALISSLPARQREVLVLTAYEHLTTAQAAEVLGLTEQNVRTTLHYARQKLRQQLAPYLNPDQR